MPRRGLTFAAVVAISLAAAAAYVVWAIARGEQGSAAPARSVAAVQEQPHVVFQSTAGEAGGPRYAKVALAPADGPKQRRLYTRLECERVYFAAGRGLCLMPDHGAFSPAFTAKVVGPDFAVRRKVTLSGILSRARISPDGRYGATTAFVTGHTYAQDTFSTKTVLIDMQRGAVVADLERDLAVLKDGRRFEREDFNFWGVTFKRDGRGFFATLRSGDKTYLLDADIPTRTARVIAENVECPSLSPDGTRIAFKRAVDGGWRVSTLDLESMRVTPLAERRSVDDQVEWLDDEHVLYGLDSNIRVVPADGSGSPRTFLSEALSPAVVRPERGL
jgi:WD40-like Beta Propeller Repeat